MVAGKIVRKQSLVSMNLKLVYMIKVMTVEALGSMFYTRMHISTVYVHKEF